MYGTQIGHLNAIIIPLVAVSRLVEVLHLAHLFVRGDLRGGVDPEATSVGAVPIAAFIDLQINVVNWTTFD